MKLSEYYQKHPERLLLGVGALVAGLWLLILVLYLFF